jgi:hypothetical protein
MLTIYMSIFLDKGVLSSSPSPTGVKVYEVIDVSDKSNVIYFSEKIALIAFVILGLIAILYILNKLIRGIVGNTSERFSKDDLIIAASQMVSAETNSDSAVISSVITTPPPVATMQETLSTTVPAAAGSPTGLPASESVNISQVPDCKPVDYQTKQKYNKYEEILLPSSLTPYISRDFVAYRENNNKDYISKRPGCMACQVDTSDKWQEKNYDNTMTNIIATCAYSMDPNNKDSNIWDKERCKSECAKLKDI